MKSKFAIVGLLIAVVTAAGIAKVTLAAPGDDFALQVSPSPIITSIKPGAKTTLELKIKNEGTNVEDLKIATSPFSVDSKTGEVKIDDTKPAEIASWISFDDPKFTLKPGQVLTERIHISLPKDTGFSYSLALVISRAKDPDPKTVSGRILKGSLAVFTLINVERPGATRKLEVTDFAATQSVYEYLPAELNISFKNSGNTIVQPAGNVFIQRNSTDTTPISTLPVNTKKGYLLPGSPRTLTTEWNNGFPYYKTVTGDNGVQKQELTWDWFKVPDFRIGPYTAKLVAIYNDGQRDIPIEREITFWVFPWRAILAIVVTILILGLIVYKLIQRGKRKAVSKALREREKKQVPPDAK